jgi:hypothetical protein
MSVLRYLPAFLISSGGLCLVLKALSPTTVDSQGILREPFFLIPVGAILIALGVLAWGVQLLLRFRRTGGCSNVPGE